MSKINLTKLYSNLNKIWNNIYGNTSPGIAVNKRTSLKPYMLMVKNVKENKSKKSDLDLKQAWIKVRHDISNDLTLLSKKQNHSNIVNINKIFNVK